MSMVAAVEGGAPAPTGAKRAPGAALAVPLRAGAAVAVSMGIYGRVHDPTGRPIFDLFFTGTLNLKVWFATATMLAAIVQLLTALRIFGAVTIPRRVPSWLGDAHRLTGTLTFVLSLPVAYHCLWAIGFQDTDARVLFHSIAGCILYGAFTAKVLFVRDHDAPSWALPVAGGTLFGMFILLWYTSSWWFFTTVGFPEL
jgi:hypothetical protein